MRNGAATKEINLELLTAAELARALKVKVAAVRAWQRQGIPFVPAGRRPRYLLADVIEWHRQRELERRARRASKKVAFCGVRVPGPLSAFALKRPRRRRTVAAA
jgi:GNAT superfamily N-acetyltransferase